MSQSAPYLEPEEPSIGVDETWSDATISTVAMDEYKSVLSHLPDLLQEFRKDAAPNNVGGMIAVKVDLHIEAPEGLGRLVAHAENYLRR